MMSEDQEAIVADRESAAHSDNRLQLRVWFRLLTVFKMIEGKLRTRLRTKFDVSIPHFDVLAILDARKEPMTMGELSAGLMVTTGNVTGIVDTMIEEGLVTRSPNPADRRSHLIQITPVGHKMFSSIAPALAKWFEEAMSSMSKAEIVLLLELLGKFKKSASKWD
jgi:DNA-binding MarR family transcriptional regulator